MNSLRLLAILSVLCLGVYTTGCETSHTETDKTGILGGHKHEETTVTKNPITGDTNVTHSERQTP